MIDMATQEILYEQEGQVGAFDLLIAGGIAVGILIVIMVVMSIVGLQTYSAVKPILESSSITGDGNALVFRNYAYTSIGSAFSSYGTLGSFIPVVVIVVVAGIVLAILGGGAFGGRAAQGGGAGL